MILEAGEAGFTCIVTEEKAVLDFLVDALAEVHDTHFRPTLSGLS